MKQFVKAVTFAICGILLLSKGYSQENTLSLQLNYNVQMPVGSFKNDVVGKASFNGWNAGLMYGLSDKFSLGVQTGFNQFTEHFGRQVYNTKDGTISAVLTNSVKTVPLQVKGRYRFFNDALVQPYVGLAAGGNLVSFNQYLGEFNSAGKTGFYFAATPEAGLMVPFGRSRNAAFNLGANFNYMPFNYSGINNLNNWGLYAGFKIPLK